jgi:hypothetical protein
MDLKTIWEYKLQVLPVLLALIIVELPNQVRRLKRFYYIPIYFPIFPFRELNPDLSLYLGEDYFLGTGPTLSDEELKSIKRKIILHSCISILITAILIPCVAGGIFAFFMDNDLFVASSVTLFIYKLVNVIRGITGFKKHAVATKKNLGLLIVIYIGYLGVFFQLLTNSFEWAKPFVEAHNYKGLIAALSNLVFSKGIAVGLILTTAGALFGNSIADKKLRDENIRNRE